MRKYQEIFNDLKEKITQHVYPVNSHLPTEERLQEEYQASRATVRKSLQMLTEQGFIRRKQGRGTIVIQSEQLNFPLSGLNSYREVSTSMNLNVHTKMLSLERIKVTPSLAKRSGFRTGQEVWKIIRLRYLEGKPAIVDTDYFRTDLVPDIKQEAIEDSIYAYVEDELGLTISYARKEITVEHTSLQEKVWLETRDESLILIKSEVFLEDGPQFQYTESRHKLDKFKFIDYARRKKLKRETYEGDD
ncbi:trehalose operon repressor [Streptococcus gallolyticus]|nr:trehalose operon repressor [Streptococcus gallolyticus]MBY5041852.1 trehalose operon repressor [Streptococcus gallolyticus]